MSRSLEQKLIESGIVISQVDGAAPIETPWFVRAIQAFSGWLAALFLLGFIGMGAVFLLDSSVASATLGLVLIGGAYALLRQAHSDFLEHLALAASLAGQMLVAWALASVLGSALGWDSAGLWWALLVLQVVLALVMPSLTHRTFSAFAACLAFYLALVETAAAPTTAGGLVLLGLTVLWLNEFRWPAHVRQLEALGYGLLLGLLVIQSVGYFGQSLLLGRYFVVSGLDWLEPWAGDALGLLALLLLLRHLFRRHVHGVQPGMRVAAYTAVLLLALLSLQARGLSHGAVVVALGFAIGHRGVMGFGGLLLLLSITSYYYWLDVTLLAKAMTLFALGLLLLAIRWALQRRWHAGAGVAAEEGGVEP
ncbi:DUF4401 domain-containing protein [Billgrantia ethanolica]|uniref:DUF4401 domain-containing protein n=1 Tax=Billgrantia ethanolica TaxID=2733486 RepID=A0ABS9A582_9GAMM|nr:DUF4401 domain-containing protein [Halomonas ethanolica]MCE8004002.1 DUF4401 domain-containing protein [Halomonas ethanolica]